MTSALVGASSVEQLEANVAALDASTSAPRARADRPPRHRERDQPLGRFEQRIERVHEPRARGSVLSAVDATAGAILARHHGAAGRREDDARRCPGGKLLAAQRGRTAAVVAPMDGFHLSNAILDALGLLSLKGAPQTFDVDGLRRALATAPRRLGHDRAWPEFDRAPNEPTPSDLDHRFDEARHHGGELPAPRTAAVARGAGPARRGVVPGRPGDILRRRLIERAMAEGRSEDDAIRHVDESELPNAELVARAKHLAELTIR